MSLTRIVILYVLLLAVIPSFSQHQNILITSENFPEEPSIIIDPSNTNRIIAGSNINNYFYSDDGGYTWVQRLLFSETLGVWGDPCVIVDTAGSVYFFHLSWPPEGSLIDRIVCQKSTNNGVTWNDGAGIGWVPGKAQDKEWAVVDRHNNHVYVTWTQFDRYGSDDPNDSSIIRFSKSVDAGITWNEPVRLSRVAGDCRDGDNTVEGAVPTVGPNGEIYVSWSGPEGIVFDRSLDGGETWLAEDILVSDHPGGWNYIIPGIFRANGMPVTTCDISGGPWHGTIYINWSDQRNGVDDTDVWLTRSHDGGYTWSAPVRVNDDPPGKHQFFTWMDIDQTNGVLYLIFYDRRNYDNSLTDVYLAVSNDGGETFRNHRISETPFLPWSTVFFGDYTNISAHDNVIRPIWTRLDEDQLSIWTAIIDTGALAVDDPEYKPFSLDQNYPNPYDATTCISFTLFQQTPISLHVFDLFGRIVSTLIDKAVVMPGKYVERFDPAAAGIPPGTYYFSLISNEIVMNRKMIYIR